MVLRRGSVTTPAGESEGSFEEFMAGALAGLLRFGYVLTGDRHRASMEHLADQLRKDLKIKSPRK